MIKIKVTGDGNAAARQRSQVSDVPSPSSLNSLECCYMPASPVRVTSRVCYHRKRLERKGCILRLFA